jgi:hypothetical protein
MVKIPENNAGEPYFSLFLGKEVVMEQVRYSLQLLKIS